MHHSSYTMDGTVYWYGKCSRTTVVVTMEKLAAAQQKQFTTMSIELSLAGLTLEPPRWVNLPLFDF